MGSMQQARRRHALLLALWLLLAALCAPAAAQAGDCDAGCDLSVLEPACGADGLTYASRCLAQCSGLTAVVSRPAALGRW